MFIFCRKEIMVPFGGTQLMMFQKCLPSIQVYGFAAAVTTECLEDHSFKWESQSKINHIYESNLLFPCTLFLTGHSFSLSQEMCSLVNLCSLSYRPCYTIQRAYILQEIKEVWTCHSEAIMSLLAGERVIASGVARCDSPGHNASFGTYSTMDTKSRLIISQETVRVTDVKNSFWMEVEGLKRCLDILNDYGLETSTLPTDRPVFQRNCVVCSDRDRRIRKISSFWCPWCDSDVHRQCFHRMDHKRPRSFTGDMRKRMSLRRMP